MLAYDWIRANQASFDADILGPLFLEVVAKDELSAAYIDHAIPPSLKSAFVATTRNDWIRLIDAMKHNGWPVRVIHEERRSTVLHHVLSAEELKERGATGYLDDVVPDADPIIKSVLSDHANLNHIGYSDVERDFDAGILAQAHDDRRGLRVFFTPKWEWSVKFSRYGNITINHVPCMFENSGLFVSIERLQEMERSEARLQVQEQRALQMETEERAMKAKATEEKVAMSKAAQERAAKQRAAEQRATEQRAMQQKAAWQRDVEAKSAETKIAKQTAAEAERKRTSEMQSASAAEKGFTEAESRARAAEASAWMASQRARATEIRAQVAEMRAQEAEGRAWSAETNARSFNERATAAEERARLAEVRLLDAEMQAKAAEQRAQAAEQRIEAVTKASEEAGEKAVKFAADAHERLVMSEKAIVKVKRYALDLRRDVESAQNLASVAREKQLEAEDQTAKWFRESSGQAQEITELHELMDALQSEVDAAKTGAFIHRTVASSFKVIRTHMHACAHA
jgi:hypothetical protein